MAKVFKKNFWQDFKKILNSDQKKLIKDFDKIDFSKITKHIKKEKDRNKDIKKNMTKEEKEKEKQMAEEEKLQYSFVIVDGFPQKIGSSIEPPGIFMGRGKHPKIGKIKNRIRPKDITINISKGSIAPKPPTGKWGSVIHDKTKAWIAKWTENISGKPKYIYLARTSGQTGKSDYDKFQKARKLQNYIDYIRDTYNKNLNSRDEIKRQISTAMWILDRLGIRVGGEKDEDKADTVGLTTLRVEHILLDSQNYVLTLDFLGKDSMRHYEKYSLFEKYGETGKQVFENFKQFVYKKNKTQQVFDKINPDILNDYLKSIMPDLTAKVFRTYNASSTLQKELHFITDPKSTLEEKMAAYNRANKEVAIICNHKKSVTKAASEVLDKNKVKLKLKKKQLKELKEMKKQNFFYIQLF